MKSSGMSRPVDELGRIVIPKEIRKSLNIAVKDLLEIHTEGDTIILKKHQPGCVFCGNTEKIVEFGEKNVCGTCIKKLEKLTK